MLCTITALRTLASLQRASASVARVSAVAAFSTAAASSSSCFFWYSGARLRDSSSCNVIDLRDL